MHAFILRKESDRLTFCVCCIMCFLIRIGCLCFFCIDCADRTCTIMLEQVVTVSMIMLWTWRWTDVMDGPCSTLNPLPGIQLNTKPRMVFTTIVDLNTLSSNTRRTGKVTSQSMGSILASWRCSMCNRTWIWYFINIWLSSYLPKKLVSKLDDHSATVTAAQGL